MNTKGIYQDMTGVITGAMMRNSREDEEYYVIVEPVERKPYVNININLNVSPIDIDKIIKAIKDHLG